MSSAIVGYDINIESVIYLDNKWFCFTNKPEHDNKNILKVSNDFMNWIEADIDGNIFNIHHNIVFTNSVYCLSVEHRITDTNLVNDNEQPKQHQILYSNDGLHWNSSELNNITYVDKLCASENLLYAFCKFVDSNKLIISENGITWREYENWEPNSAIHYLSYSRGLLYIIFGDRVIESVTIQP